MGITSKTWDYGVNADSAVEDRGRGRKSRDVYAVRWELLALSKVCLSRSVAWWLRAKAGAPINPSCSAPKTFLETLHVKERPLIFHVCPQFTLVYPSFPHVLCSQEKKLRQGAVPNSLASTSLARWISFSGAMGNLLCAMVFLGTAVARGWLWSFDFVGSNNFMVQCSRGTTHCPWVCRTYWGLISTYHVKVKVEHQRLGRN